MYVRQGRFASLALNFLPVYSLNRILNEIAQSLPRQSWLHLLALRIIVIDLDTLEPFHATSWPSVSLPTTLIVQLHNSRCRPSRARCCGLSSTAHGNLCRRWIGPTRPCTTSASRGPTRIRILWDGRILRRRTANERLTLRVPCMSLS
jgi:hypothetical protein